MGHAWCPGAGASTSGECGRRGTARALPHAPSLAVSEPATIPVFRVGSVADGLAPRVAEFVINPNGKSEVCILHEYMQRVLKVRPVYNFFECGKCGLAAGWGAVARAGWRSSFLPWLLALL